MNTIDIKIILKWASVVLWAALIFMFSAQNGEQSGGLSNKIIESVVMPVLEFTGIKYESINFSAISFLVRKAAHMFIYFVLAILAVNAVLGTFSFNNGLIPYGIALGFCFLYAISDEFHQSFSPGRNMAFADIMIDTAGAFLGLCLYALIKKIINTGG